MDKHASSLNNLSILFGEAGQREERMRTLAESTALRQQLVAATPADDPRRERFLSNLGSCYGNLGSGHLDDGDLDEAITWTRKALAIQDEPDQETPQLRGLSRTRRRQPYGSRSARAPDRSSRRPRDVSSSRRERTSST